MSKKKDPFFKDMVRIASSIRLESDSFLKDESGTAMPYVQEQFSKFSFLKEDSIRNVVSSYISKTDRGL